MLNGEIREHAQRHGEYTRLLGERIVERYHAEQHIFSSHILAFVGFEMLKDRFKLDFGFANELEVIDGRLTGEVTGTIVDGARKAQVLKDMSHVFGVHIAQTIAVGDGANDIDMLKTAGLGIAYQAKPRLQEVAHARLNHHDRLDTLLYLMGFDAPEVVHACRGPELP